MTGSLPVAVFEITFEANQTFGLTASEIGQTKAKLVRPKTYFYQSTGYNYEKSISIHKLGVRQFV